MNFLIWYIYQNSKFSDWSLTTRLSVQGREKVLKGIFGTFSLLCIRNKKPKGFLLVRNRRLRFIQKEYKKQKTRRSAGSQKFSFIAPARESESIGSRSR